MGVPFLYSDDVLLGDVYEGVTEEHITSIKVGVEAHPMVGDVELALQHNLVVESTRVGFY